MSYRAKERLCLDRDRTKVVPCDSSEAGVLLVAEGGTVTDEMAKKYGLREQTKDAKSPDAKAVKGPPQDKAMKGPPETKER